MSFSILELFLRFMNFKMWYLKSLLRHSNAAILECFGLEKKFLESLKFLKFFSNVEKLWQFIVAEKFHRAFHSIITLFILHRDESLMLIREIKVPSLGSNSSKHQVAHERVTRSRDDDLMNHRWYFLAVSPKKGEGCATWANASYIDEIRAIDEDVVYRVSSMIIKDPGRPWYASPLSNAKSYSHRLPLLIYVNAPKLQLVTIVRGVARNERINFVDTHSERIFRKNFIKPKASSRTFKFRIYLDLKSNLMNYVGKFSNCNSKI